MPAWPRRTFLAKETKGRYSSDVWELIQAQTCGSVNTSIKFSSWGFGFGLVTFPEAGPFSQYFFMTLTLKCWDFADGWYGPGRAKSKMRSTALCKGIQ